MKLTVDYENIKTLTNYVAGELTPATSGRMMDNYEPATGSVYSQTPMSDDKDVQKAVESAKQAFPAWSALSGLERAEYLRRLATAIDENHNELVWAESVDNGKPVKLSAGVDIPRCSYNLRFFADAITQYGGEAFRTNKNIINYVEHEPLGVVGCISPWNLPLYSLTWKIAPALVTGNCVIAKPSEVTPLTAYLFSKICQDILPPGVLNILHGRGDEVGAAICTHPEIAAISFTGSTATGRKVNEMAAPTFKKVSLEMGGKNPTIVFADADIRKAVKGVLRAAFTNQGQVCLCGSRIFIEKSIYEPMKKHLVEEASKLTNGDPLERRTLHGAVVSKPHFDKICSYLDLAKEEGGTILCGGEPAHIPGRCEKGWFVKPTLIEGLPNQCRTNQEEIFGPVATLQSFESEDEAIRLANETEYGLSASVWTENLNRAHRVGQALHTGTVWVNTWMARDLRVPFGGAKNSGLGREGGQEALHFFTDAKVLSINTAEA